MNLKSKSGILLMLASGALLLGCRTVGVKVPLDNARFSHGILNSQAVPLSAVYIHDTESKAFWMQTFFTQGQYSQVVSGPVFGSKVDTALSDLAMEFEALVPLQPAIEAQARAKIAKSVTIDVQNFQRQVFFDPAFFLNSPALRTWRQTMAEAGYADPRFQFFLVGGVVNATSADISLAQTTGGGAAANIVEFGKYRFDINFTGQQGTSVVANGGPIFIHLVPFRFQASPDGRSLRFVRTPEVRFNFQQLANAGP